MSVYAFGYYGGKLSHLKRLLPLLPTAGVQTFVEPFCGSAAVALNRDPAPVEVINDLDGELVTFFRVLRERPDELIRLLELTPYSRSEFVASCQPSAELLELEVARRFFVKIGQSYSNVPNSSPGRWSYSIASSNRGVSAAVSGWLSLVDRLAGVAQRLRQIQIECLPALDVIERYDGVDTLFYVDPPYLPSTRGNHADCYVHEMTEADHIALLQTLRGCRGRVALSGYASELYRALLPGWCVTAFGSRTSAASAKSRLIRSARQEVLWTNYDPVESLVLSNGPLFDMAHYVEQAVEF